MVLYTKIILAAIGVASFSAGSYGLSKFLESSRKSRENIVSFDELINDGERCNEELEKENEEKLECCGFWLGL